MGGLRFKAKNEKLTSDLFKLINEIIEDNNLKTILINFTKKCSLTLLQDADSSTIQNINFNRLKQVICSMSLLKTINDLNWDFFCYIFNNYELCIELAINFTEPYEDSYLYKKLLSLRFLHKKTAGG